MDKCLTVIIPFYNEESFLVRLVETLKVTENMSDISFLFVDDASSDKSLEVLFCALKDSKINCSVKRLTSNAGKAGVIKSVVAEITSTHIAILDADLELNCEDLLKMWEVSKNIKQNVVFGYRRFLSHSSFTYRYTIGNRIISHLYGVFFNSVVTDVMCGLKMLPTEILRESKFRAKRFAFEVEIAAVIWSQHEQIYEFEVNYSPRGWDQGKVIGIKDAVYILYIFPILRYLYRRKPRREK